jgi:hypothetical protein
MWWSGGELGLNVARRTVPGVNRDVESRADVLICGFGDEAVEDGILRVQDNRGPFTRAEAERWISATFALVRRPKPAKALSFRHSLGK